MSHCSIHIENACERFICAGLEHEIARLLAENERLNSSLLRTPPRAEEVKLRDKIKALESRLAQVREALKRAHVCATVREDGTCDGCFVSRALEEPR